jgi:hypothetical protein
MKSHPLHLICLIPQDAHQAQAGVFWRGLGIMVHANASLPRAVSISAMR